jgi:hypothetical protein
LEEINKLGQGLINVEVARVDLNLEFMIIVAGLNILKVGWAGE